MSATDTEKVEFIEEAEKTADFELDAAEEELLEEYGVLIAAEYNTATS